MIVDAHHHLWDPRARRHAWLAGHPALQREFGPVEYARLAGEHEVTASVLVQVLASTGETQEFLAVAASDGVVAGVVGWVDLTGPDVPGELARLRESPGGRRLAGIRHLVQGEPDPGWLDRPDVRRGLQAVGAAGLVYDLLVGPPQLPAAVRAVRGLPGVSFVLDHGGKPGIAAAQHEPWAALISGLAALPNVVCKLSGLVTEAGPGWNAARIAPYAARLIDAFGPARLMFGSDWPVCTLAASYAEVVGLARTLLAPHLDQPETDAVLSANASRVYRLPPPPDPGGPSPLTPAARP